MTTAIITTTARTIPTEAASKVAAVFVFMSSSAAWMSPMSVLIVAMSPCVSVTFPVRSPNVVLMVGWA